MPPKFDLALSECLPNSKGMLGLHCQVYGQRDTYAQHRGEEKLILPSVRSKLPDCAAADLDEKEGAWPVPGDLPVLPGDSGSLELACLATNADAEATECMIVDAPKPGGALLVMKTVPAPAEDTTSVELTSAVKGAATARPEVLEPCVGREGWQGHNKAPQDGTAVDSNDCQERLRPLNV
jgi:hypothetical protein